MKKGKRILALLAAAMLTASMLTAPSAAADWPQFLGDPASQGVSNGDGVVSGKDLTLRWEKNTGNTWCDVPGTPIVVGDYVYYYSSQYLRKLELATGKEVARVPVYGEPVNQFFINIAYGEGKIFVPCQKDNLDDAHELKGCFLRVYDAETLEQLYITESLGSGQPQSPVMYHDGYFVTGIYGRNAVYAGFTAEDEDSTRPDEIKKVSWTAAATNPTGFGFNGAAFVGEYCYFGCASTLYIVDYKTGEVRTFDIGEGYGIRSTIVYSNENGRLYVAANHPDNHAAVFSYELEADGMPKMSSERSWISSTKGGGTQSTPVIYRGRLYIGGGGHTMGSNEPFHVLDAVTLKEIYSVPILSKGSAGVTSAYATAENGWQVYVYMTVYAPNKNGNAEICIISDRQGQTAAKYELVEKIGHGQYCSQSLIVAHDGSLVWYNDGGYIYCYENSNGIFDDTKSHWARENIAFLARRGIVNGIGNNMYNPSGTVMRSHFVRTLANMSGEDFSACTTSVFRDVGTQWYAPAVAWAVEKGIVDADTGMFRPNDPITREDMALMLYRYTVNVAKTQLPAVNAPITFKDAGTISKDAMEAVSVMQQGGIINGIGSGTNMRFEPETQATRAHLAAMIARFCTVLNG